MGELDLDDAPGPPADSWLRYLYGVARVLQEDGVPLTGLDLAITSSVPTGAGLSSSAALELGCALAWLAAQPGVPRTIQPTPHLAELCRRAEVEYAGVACGIMDQFVCAMAQRGQALLLDTHSLDFRQIPLPPDRVRIVIVDSQVPRTLATSAFNERRAECGRSLKLLQQVHRTPLESLCDLRPADLVPLLPRLPAPLDRRVRHVVEEDARVLEAVAAFEHGDLNRVGQLMHESHRSLRDLYEVSAPELDLLVHLANEIPGVFGARLTGAGFGGCTVNLVAVDSVSRLRGELPRAYRRATGREASVYVTRASAGAGARRIA